MFLPRLNSLIDNFDFGFICLYSSETYKLLPGETDYKNISLLA